MSALTATSAVAQILGGIFLSPLLTGLIQYWKAKLQGRCGPSPLKPYRDLRRLWGKSSISVQGASFIYRLAPAVTVAALGTAILLVPICGGAANFGVGNDVLALIGLLALARFAVAAAAWDVGNGFSLMGASRDLMISIAIEVTLIAALTVAVLLTGTTDITGLIKGTAGIEIWSSPALVLAGLAFALVVVGETGRQPIDNPDTHLELTMVHEGPLLEYGGRDLAYLQWAAAARHWIVLVLAAGIFLPHPEAVWWQLLVLPATILSLCGLLAVTETLRAKMRILVVPRLFMIGATVGLLGVVAGLTEM
jgi:formate hydrogenlyase subunit 4